MKKYRCLFWIMTGILLSALIPVNASATSTPWTGEATQPTKIVVVDDLYFYEISTAEELAFIAQAGGEWLGYNYRLANDIVLNQADLTYDSAGNLTADASSLKEWTPIQDFTGIFDGCGHTVSGVYIDGKECVGFFGDCTGFIYNLTLTNSYIKGTGQVGGICAYFHGIGMDMINCFFDGAVVGSTKVGGIVGENHCTTFTGCGNYGDIFGTGDYVCGVVGYYSAYGIDQCFNEGNVYSTGNYVAGIAGSTHIYGITDGINRGAVTGNNYVGGICGYVEDAWISGCGNSGTVNGNEYVGGITGYSTYYHVISYVATLTECYNNASIAGTNCVGGITGYVEYADLTDCQNIGNVTGNTAVGGIVGHSESIWGKGTITNCHYLKNDSVNTNLNGFGNVEDADGIVSAQAMSFFCVDGETIHVAGHTYADAVACQAQCTVCGQAGAGSHTFDQLNYNEEGHWYSCVCGEADPVGIQLHTGGSATCALRAQCAVCGQAYADLGEHTFVDTFWVFLDDQTHAYGCSVCGALEPNSAQPHSGGDATCSVQAKCELCGEYYGALSSHDFDNSTWTYADENGHACSCSVCGEYSEILAHRLIGSAQEDRICQDCGYCVSAKPHEHTMLDEWQMNTTYHWHPCSDCGEKLEKEKHEDDDDDGLCDVCLKEMKDNGSTGNDATDGGSVIIAGLIGLASGLVIGAVTTVVIMLSVWKKRTAAKGENP